MTSGLQGDSHSVLFKGLAIGKTFDSSTLIEAGSKHELAGGRRQIGLTSCTNMVAMPVRDDRPRHGLPGIDEEIALHTIQSLGSCLDQILSHTEF